MTLEQLDEQATILEIASRKLREERYALKQKMKIDLDDLENQAFMKESMARRLRLECHELRLQLEQDNALNK